MNSLAICIFFACAAILPHQGDVQATLTGVQLNVCGSANGYACLRAGATGGAGNGGIWAACTDYKVTGPPTECTDATNYICYPGIETNTQQCGPEITATCSENANVSIATTGVRCKNYYTCILGGKAPNPEIPNQKVLMACPEGQEFHPVKKGCLATAIAECSVINPPEPPGTCVPMVLGEDPTSCRHYYECNYLNVRTRKQCPDSKLFDTTYRDCRDTTDCGTRKK